MVRETKTLGQGDVGVPEPRHLPTVRNIVVYGKKKNRHKLILLSL